MRFYSRSQQDDSTWRRTVPGSASVSLRGMRRVFSSTDVQRTVTGDGSCSASQRFAFVLRRRPFFLCRMPTAALAPHRDLGVGRGLELKRPGVHRNAPP